MQIVYHIGVHATDEDALLRSLVKNREALVQHKVALPGPGRYRQLVRETLQAMAEGAVAKGRDEVLTEILGKPGAQRMILSNRNFICVPNRIFEGGELYALADAKLIALGQLFAEDEIEIQLGIRDPATFVPAAYALSSGRSFDSFLNGISPDNLYWSDLIDRIRDILPNAKITVWCNEDTPFIWPHILRSLAGFEATDKIAGGYDLIASVLTEEGVRKLQGYFTTNPPRSETQRQKVLVAFLERFAKDDALEEEIDAPGWTEELMDDLSEGYDEDVADIAARDDITFLAPSI
ncbi:MAG: hypothetical protein ACWA40_05120 [Planktomarina sp.]